MVQAKEVSYSKKQRFNRYNVNLVSTVSSDTTSYAGFTKNVSEEGLAYETYYFPSTLKRISTKEIIDLMLKMPSGEILKLNCAIKWSSEHSPWSLFKMGMKIIDPPIKYREYVKTLQ